MSTSVCLPVQLGWAADTLIHSESCGFLYMDSVDTGPGEVTGMAGSHREPCVQVRVGLIAARGGCIARGPSLSALSWSVRPTVGRDMWQLECLLCSKSDFIYSLKAGVSTISQMQMEKQGDQGT